MLEPRGRSTLSRLDDWALVVIGLVAGLIVLAVISFVVHTVIFLLKVAIVAAVAGLVFRAVVNRR